MIVVSKSYLDGGRQSADGVSLGSLVVESGGDVSLGSIVNGGGLLVS